MSGPSCTDSSAARQHQPALTHPFVPTGAGPWHSPPGDRMEGQEKLWICNMINYSNDLMTFYNFQYHLLHVNDKR